MKGFKSFADNTVLEFEPGVTAVVGPNGSGKSNVVDAVTWVLGAQSTRALRSAKMDDVIFAGTAHRAALGRAEVALTLDNTSGKLAIDGAEVTISRTLFRNGDSEYAINATTCRLLDVQELLSDSGVGRQQHMIIGQGQLDAILNSSSENRRAVIEEAAGVLKHRRRKERAERRLSATQENLERLGDLVREVRRQMRPLERQAVSARSYADVERELRVARQSLFHQRLDAFDRRKRELEDVIHSSAELERELRNELVTLDAQATTAAAEMVSRREEMLASTLGTLQGLAERARGTLSVIAERERSLRAALVASADENVIATLEADAAKLAAELVLVEADEETLREMRDALRDAEAIFADTQIGHDETWGSVSLESDETAWRTAAQRVALLERSRAAATQSERRSQHRLADALSSVDEATASLSTVVTARDEAAASVARVTTQLNDAQHDAESAEAGRESADEALAKASDAVARTQARAEALGRALEELSGSGGRAIIGKLEGVLGAFLDLIEVDEGWESAVESAAGASVGAMVVDGRRSAQAALEALRREGGAGLILPVAETPIAPVDTPQGCVALRSLVRARSGAPAHVARVLDALFSRAFVIETWQGGIDVAVAHPDLVVVTRDGDRFAASGWRVASGRALVTRATVDDAQRAAAAAAEALAPCRERRQLTADAATAARQRVNACVNARTRAEAEVERREREITRLNQQATDAESQVATLAGEVESVAAERQVLDAELRELHDQLPALERAVTDAAVRQVQADESRARVESLRQEAQAAATALSRREAEVAERRRLIEQRRSEIEARLEGRSLERAQAAERRESLEFDLQVLARLTKIVAYAAEDIRLSQEAMDSTYREQLEASRASAERLETVRHARQSADERLAQVADRAHRGQIEHAELAVKVTNLHEAIRRDLGVEPHQLDAVAAPELAGGVSLESFVGDLEARITSLGPINPLALEELAALEERYQELDAQVADVRHARRELQEVVRALDEEIMQTFSLAVADVNEHFSTLISMLFPGGQGRLILTEPDDPLNTGVEIEVRPMGRNVRRISLLSGGERSMAALAFLFAVFRSRPSPFYMMDEVEAALDDVNLQRFLSLVDEFRDEAQLLIVTHQKRTMEAADALYGVTMVPGASSKVVSQRVKKTPEEVPA
jgi:chromosome segregation protein